MFEHEVSSTCKLTTEVGQFHLRDHLAYKSGEFRPIRSTHLTRYLNVYLARSSAICPARARSFCYPPTTMSEGVAYKKRKEPCGFENCRSKLFYTEGGYTFCKEGHRQEVGVPPSGLVCQIDSCSNNRVNTDHPRDSGGRGRFRSSKPEDSTETRGRRENFERYSTAYLPI